MGLADFFSDIYGSLSWTEAHAEAKQEEEESDDSEDKEEGDDDSGEGKDKDDEGGDEEGGDDEGGDDEEEEEEEEPEDPKPKLEEGTFFLTVVGRIFPNGRGKKDVDGKRIRELTLIDCANSAQCSQVKHHFDECVTRVHAQQEDEDYKGPHEDCVEECEFLFLSGFVFVAFEGPLWRGRLHWFRRAIG